LLTAPRHLQARRGDIGDGQIASWGYPEGGMGAVSKACEDSARFFGAEIRTNARVQRVLTTDGRVRGVILESGERLEAPVVAAAVHPRTLAIDLVGRRQWPAEVVRDIERFRTRGGAVKINMVVSDLPRWRGIEGPDLERVWRDGDFAVCPSIEHLERSWQHALMGEMSPQCGYLEVLTPSAGDPTLIDEGLPGHVMSLYTQFGPPQREIWTDATREAYAAAAMDLLRTAAPNMTDSVIMHREVLAPPDLEDVFGLIGGNIFHGELSLEQLFHMRPAPGYADYRTPVAGLYNASSATHAGGGVCGIPGWQAARIAIADRKRESRPGLTSLSRLQRSRR